MNLDPLSLKIRNVFSLAGQSRTPHPKRAAVLVVLFPREGLAQVLMILRALHLNAHAGEVAFPGGVPEAQDVDLLATALRETEEEIGLRVAQAAVIGCLTPVATRTGYLVWPYVAALPACPRLEPASEEVSKIFEIPLAPLFRTGELDARFPTERDMTVYHFHEHRIWGASARVLRQIECLNGHA